MLKILIALALSSPAMAQECSHLWQYDVTTGPVGPKPYNGDTYAAYGVFKFKSDPNTVLRLKGTYPKARFFSLESYKNNKNHSHAALFDFQIEPDAGSVNPFQDGSAIDATERNYSITAVPEGSQYKSGMNHISLDSTATINSLWVRYYAPFEGVTFSASDLPRIDAVDATTGESAACPEIVDETKFTSIPAALTILAPKRRQPFPFKLGTVPWAGNAGVGRYAYGLSRMRFNEVMVAKFKAPSFTNTQSGAGTFSESGDVRYWSICSANFVQNAGLACLADYNASVDKDGFVTVVFGSDRRLIKAAKSRGHDFLPDNRKATQFMVMLAYRNILASEEFTPKKYQGDYLPRAVICAAEDYLANDCPL